MKICALVTTFPRFNDDTEVPWLRELIRRLREQGDDVHVWAPSFEGLPSHKIDQIPVHRYRYFFKSWENLTHDEGAPNKIHKWHYKLITLFFMGCGIIKSFFHIWRQNYNLLHVHWPFPTALSAILPHFLLKKPYILHFYGADLLIAKRFPFVRWFLDFFLRHASSVIAISNFTADQVRAIRDIPITIIPYGAAIEDPPTGESVPRDVNAPFKILFVGRLIERKGISFLIDAVHLLHYRGVSVQLDIVGSGNLLEELQQQIQTLGADSYIHLHGRVSELQKVEFYQRADLFALPSIIDRKGDTEGLGVVLLEAYLYRVPVVASQIGGIPDVVNDGITGRLVPPGDAEALAQIIRDCLENPKESHRMAQKGFEFVSDYFSWDRIIDQVRDVYRQVNV